MILETIAEATRKRVAAEKEKCSLAEMKEKATAMNPDTGFPFELSRNTSKATSVT